MPSKSWIRALAGLVPEATSNGFLWNFERRAELELLGSWDALAGLPECPHSLLT
jgi:hypothetical protein